MLTITKQNFSIVRVRVSQTVNWKVSHSIAQQLEHSAWVSHQIRKSAGCTCAGNAGNVFPRNPLQRKPLISDPGMHHGTSVTHLQSYMPGSLTRGGEDNVLGIPGVCATRSFTYLVRGPCNRIRLVQEQLFTVENGCWCPRIIDISHVNLYIYIYIYIYIYTHRSSIGSCTVQDFDVLSSHVIQCISAAWVGELFCIHGYLPITTLA